MREVTDLDGGRCLVILGDGETHDGVGGCMVRFATQDQIDAWEQGDYVEGYRDISIEDLVRHYLATKV